MKNIIEIFNNFYDIYKDEFNNGHLAVVGSLLYHITGVKEKKGNGDIDILLLTDEAEHLLIKKAHFIDNDMTVVYKPKHPFRRVKLWFDNGRLIESFTPDYNEGEMKTFTKDNKEYTMFVQDPLVSLHNTIIILSVVNDKMKNTQHAYDINPSAKLESGISKYRQKVEKQISNVEFLFERYKPDTTSIENYMLYEALKDINYG